MCLIIMPLLNAAHAETQKSSTEPRFHGAASRRGFTALEEQSSNACIDEVALLPKELSVPVSKENTALVSKHERRALIGMS